ncbi:YcaO-like family protein [Phaeobacter sp. B1627]|uniref:YcaO-like family protein n=1 Tax=Phaeobacter sp. B1627 TaxID=2583809 RepID=UPI00111923E3|nr:YcaO-like family protein [Phaeobacter sp. B1627]TNJ38752.1 hypothetical protein FGE21_19470 [Phaeobacter sp. B1627]
MVDTGFDRRLISAPAACDMPDGFPFRAALCAVNLDQHNGAVLLSSGFGETEEEAGFLAEMEAAERYSLTYDPLREDPIAPILWAGGSAQPLPQADLALRAPGRKNRSHGAAAGPEIDKACRAALLEMLEHIHIEPGRGSQFFELDLPVLPAARAMHDWCRDRHRALSCQVCDANHGYVVVRARCSDLNGGRPTYGSAAASDPVAAVISALREAIFSWRNMVELESRGAQAGSDPLSQSALLEYRGATVARPWPQCPIGEIPRTSSCTSTKTLLGHLSELVQERVQLFDLTHPSFQIPVARVFIG